MASYAALLKKGVGGANAESTSSKPFITAKYVEYNKDIFALERESLYHYKCAFYTMI